MKVSKTMLLGTSGALLAGCGASEAEKTKQPNVLFILVDDFGWADVSYNGSTFYETPNIDRLASEGMVFTDGYAAASISSPTRVSLMTGKYPARTQVTDWILGYQWGLNEEQLSKYKMIVPVIEPNMKLEEVTMAEAMKEGGYDTYFIGKWHCANDSTHYPEYQGFDVNIGGWHKGGPNGNRRSGGGEGAYNTPYNNPYLTDGPAGEYLTDRLTDEAIKLIDRSIASPENDPFFLYLSYYSVHVPIEPKPELTEYFKAKAERMGIDKIDPFTQDLQWYNDADYKAWHWKERTIQSDAEYAALIYAMDQNIGRLLDKLVAEGLDKNTIVCFTADNGGLSTAEGSHTTNYPLRAGKGWLYEGGIREPFIIKYPGVIEAGSECNTPVVSTDFYPTILDLAGLPLKEEQHCDGESLKPLLTQQGTLERESIFFHYPHYGGKGDSPAGVIRKGDMKLIEFFETGKYELYNLREDISETNDLSDSLPEVLEAMKTELHQWQKNIDAQMPVMNPGYKAPQE
ncbi:MAG: sulfatase [Rikenellaceae bacterium]